jgi:quinolinate synthase
VLVDPALIPRAVKPLKRMLDFNQAARQTVSGNA